MSSNSGPNFAVIVVAIISLALSVPALVRSCSSTTDKETPSLTTVVENLPTWESIETCSPVHGYRIHLLRLKVFGGWLVSRSANTAMAYIPDANHVWLNRAYVSPYGLDGNGQVPPGDTNRAPSITPPPLPRNK